MLQNKKARRRRGRLTSLSHFGSPSIQKLDGSFVPLGYPSFTLSVTCVTLMLSHVNELSTKKLKKY
jgi:hypothetical protein